MLEDLLRLVVLVDRAREDMDFPGRHDRASYSFRENTPPSLQERLLIAPKIFSHASPFAVIPEAVKVKIEASGMGLLSPWSPQQYILSHPVRAQ